MTMKTFRLFSMAALALMMAACSNEDSALENAAPAQQQGAMKFTATLAAPGSGATTRTTYTEVTEGDDAGKIKVAWKAGDQIYLYDLDNGAECTATVGTPAASGSATISGTFDYDVEAGENITATYPASAANDDFINAKFASQAGTIAYIQDNLDYRKGTSTISVDGTDATLATALQMESQIAIWKLTLQDNAATPAALSATKVTIKNGSTVIAATTDITATSAVYLALNLKSGNISGADITIEATVGSDTYTYSKSGVSLAKGNYYQSTVTLAKAAPSYDQEVNLSTTSSDVTVPEGKHWLINGSKGNICVTIGDGATVTLNGVEIYMNKSKPCIKCSGDATIILADGTTNTLTSVDNGCGIQGGPSGKTLTIKGNTGVLNVVINHTSNATAIGAYNETACGDIVIEGGVINATSQNGAAIGACYEAACGNITINGGTVTATAGGTEDNSGVGIGGHYNTACGNITITGGTVTATGFNLPGIGGYNICGDITISGGTVTATKGEAADKCIGTADGTCGTITIGGKVYWDGSNYQNDGDTYLTQDQIIYPTPAP